MNKRNLTIIGSVAVVVIAIGTYAVVNKPKSDTPTSSNSTSEQSSSNNLIDKNSPDYQMYSNLRGDDYDRMFIANMIEHHKGAVEMAKLAQVNARHQELKTMADSIITAQSKEIADMERWQVEWGYPVSSGEMMMDHSAMGMMTDMGQMTEDLIGLSGDAFDKAFLSSMIAHHQSAINMAAPGASNAEHQEIKDLTATIVSAQTSEIQQMKKWQQEWGY